MLLAKLGSSRQHTSCDHVQLPRTKHFFIYSQQKKEGLEAEKAERTFLGEEKAVKGGLSLSILRRFRVRHLRCELGRRRAEIKRFLNDT